MTGMANLANRLGEAIGTHRVIAAGEELNAYAVDGREPTAIVHPATAEEAAEVVRFAVAEKLGLVALGSRSKSEMGTPPIRYDVALDMTGLREVAHYDAGDLTLSVDAGLPLRELEGFLRRHGQFLPLAVPCFESTTAGGTVASGIDSSLRQQYGTARDFLIGAEFVDGTGQLCKSGGRVVKNVTGYDLHKLLIGSLGTLGVITRLNFRTFPLPAASGGRVASFRNCEQALAYRRAAEKAGLPLANLEVLSPEVGRIIRAILAKAEESIPRVLERESWMVYSSFEGNEALVQRISGELEKKARSAGAVSSEDLDSAADETLGGMLREAYEWLRWAAPANAICRLALPEVTAEIPAELSRLAGTAKLRSALLVRAAGIIYFSVFAEEESETAVAALMKVIAGVRFLAATKHGHVSLLHGPLATREKEAEAEASRRDSVLPQRVKQAFDPSGVFAPGRVVGGNQA